MGNFREKFKATIDREIKEGFSKYAQVFGSIAQPKNPKDESLFLLIAVIKLAD
jgi:hypothetical protein